MFAYCGNNPISRADNDGEAWNILIGAVVGGVVGTISTAATGGNLRDIIINAAAGAIAGAIVSSGLDFRVARMAASTVIGAGTAIDCYINGADTKTSVLCGVMSATIAYGTITLSGGATSRLDSAIIDSSFGLGGAIISSTISVGATEISKARKKPSAPSIASNNLSYGAMKLGYNSKHRLTASICIK